MGFFKKYSDRMKLGTKTIAEEQLGKMKQPGYLEKKSSDFKAYGSILTGAGMVLGGLIKVFSKGKK